MSKFKSAEGIGVVPALSWSFSKTLLLLGIELGSYWSEANTSVTLK